MGDVPLHILDGKAKHLEDVLRVLSITKSLVSIGQMVEQDLQVCFNPLGCFVEDFKDGSKLVTKANVREKCLH